MRNRAYNKRQYWLYFFPAIVSTIDRGRYLKVGSNWGVDERGCSRPHARPQTVLRLGVGGGRPLSQYVRRVSPRKMEILCAKLGTLGENCCALTPTFGHKCGKNMLCTRGDQTLFGKTTESVHCTTGACLRMHHRPSARTLQHMTVPIRNIRFFDPHLEQWGSIYTPWPRASAVLRSVVMSTVHEDQLRSSDSASKFHRVWKNSGQLTTVRTLYLLLLLLLLLQVVTLQHQYVRPVSDDLSEMKLSNECKTLTGLCEENIRNAQPLDHVLDDVSNFASCECCQC